VNKYALTENSPDDKIGDFSRYDHCFKNKTDDPQNINLKSMF